MTTTLRSLPIESVVAAYFDSEALREPPYKLYRIVTPKGRFYYTMEDNVPQMYLGVTSMLAMVIPKPQGLIKWICDMGWEKSQAYMHERAWYGTLLHKEIEYLLINKKYDFALIDQIIDTYCADNSYIIDVEKWNADLKQDMLAFVKFCHDYNVKPIAVEIMLTHPEGYSGTIDIIAYMDIEVEGDWGEKYKSGPRKDEVKLTKKAIRMLCVIDVKSTRKSTSHEEKDVQLEAYKQLIEHNFPELKIERIFNWSPKDWRGSTPTYNLNDKTNSVDMQKFYAWIRVAQIEMDKKDTILGDINGQIVLGDDPSALYSEMTLEQYIIEHHKKRFETP